MPWFISKHLNMFRDRNFHLSAVNMQQEVAKHEPFLDQDMKKVPVRRIDKILLVWSGKYKSAQEVPSHVSRAVLTKSHNMCRIKVCNYVMVITIISAVLYAMSGKRDAKKGLTVAEMNKKWHEEYNKKYDNAQKTT